jgi:hypothetical protein
LSIVEPQSERDAVRFHEVAVADLELARTASDKPSFIGGAWGASSVILGALVVAWLTTAQHTGTED